MIKFILIISCLFICNFINFLSYKIEIEKFNKKVKKYFKDIYKL
jgi:hypothetical protein